MISISRLLCGGRSFGDSLRYEMQRHGDMANDTVRPVVVWNSTRSCNLGCIHCYSASEPRQYPNELTTDEAERMIDDLADFKVPVLLISGGEPFVRTDIVDLAEYAAERGIRTTFSTNGLLLTRDIVRRLKTIGCGYVGISFDGIGASHDYFRGRRGAFEQSLKAVRTCLEEGQKVGIRFTINRYNHREVGSIFDLIQREDIPRVCFYHLVYTGRGAELQQNDLLPEETRMVMDLVMDRTEQIYDSGHDREVLSVDNHADGVYLYLRLLKHNPARAEQALALLKQNGGNRSGIAIGCIDSQGNVLPDQFTHGHVLGSVRTRSFWEIWTDESNPVIRGLRDRKPLLKGKCANCTWQSVCNGNFRARAEAVYHDLWAEDPGCYLTPDELASGPDVHAAAREVVDGRSEH